MRLLPIVGALFSHAPSASASDLIVAVGATEDLLEGSYTYGNVQVFAA